MPLKEITKKMKKKIFIIVFLILGITLFSFLIAEPFLVSAWQNKGNNEEALITYDKVLGEWYYQEGVKRAIFTKNELKIETCKLMKTYTYKLDFSFRPEVNIVLFIYDLDSNFVYSYSIVFDEGDTVLYLYDFTIKENINPIILRRVKETPAYLAKK
jgi:hypothetical protein